MSSAKQIRVDFISRAAGNALVKRYHYSGKVVPNSQIHLGVSLDGRLLGCLQFGPPMDKRKVQALVKNTGWNDFLELNRMAFADELPRNSESRAIAIAMRLLRKQYPHLRWIISFADATQCGDGTIYRASGFVLTQIRKNHQIMELPDGSRVSKMTMTKAQHLKASGGAARPPEGARFLPGFQLRYVYFLDPAARADLAVASIPYGEIDIQGAGMYKGKSRGKQAAAGTTSTAAGQHRPPRSNSRKVIRGEEGRTEEGR